MNRSFTSFYDYVDKGKQYNTENLLAEIQANVLVIHGDKDTVIEQSMAEELAARLQRAEIYLISNAGHMLNWTNSEEVNNAIENFLKQ